MDDTLNTQETADDATLSGEAVASPSGDEQVAQVQEPDQATSQGEAPAEAPLLDGKFKTEDARQSSYRELERKFHQQAGELAALRRQAEGRPQQATATDTEPAWKKLEVERNKWAAQLRRSDLSEQDKWQADEQVRLHDREIMRQQVKYEMEQERSRATATQSLEQESQGVMEKFAPDLNDMSSALYRAASQRYTQLVQAGYPDTVNTKALAVTYAAAITGSTAEQAVRKDRSAMLKTLNANAKKAVVAGAGGPATVKPSGVTAKDIENMSSAEFAKYERALMGV